MMSLGRGIEREEYRALARALRGARLEAGLSQRGLANLAGIKQGKISSVEHGLGNPTLRTLSKMARACGVTLSISPSGGDKESLES